MRREKKNEVTLIFSLLSQTALLHEFSRVQVQEVLLRQHRAKQHETCGTTHDCNFAVLGLEHPQYGIHHVMHCEPKKKNIFFALAIELNQAMQGIRTK